MDCITLRSVSSFCEALWSSWQGKKASAFPKESNYYPKAFPFSRLTERPSGKTASLHGFGCTARKILTLCMGRLSDGRSCWFTVFYRGSHYTFTGHTGERERAEGMHSFHLKCLGDTRQQNEKPTGSHWKFKFFPIWICNLPFPPRSFVSVARLESFPPKHPDNVWT